MTRYKSYQTIVQCLAVLLLGFASYSNSFDVPLQFDDFTALRKTINGSLKLGLDGGLRWVTDLTFSLNRLAHGELVIGYHVVNLSIHLATALSIYACLRAGITALRSSPTTEVSPEEPLNFLEKYIPFATAALFVSHPVQTQAVTYIAQRYTSLATFFYLAAMFAYCRARLAYTTPSKHLPVIWAFVTLLSALLAMMSKEIAFTLPAMLILLEITLFGGRLLKRPLFLAAIFGLVAVIPLQSLILHGSDTSTSLIQNLQRVSTEVHTISRSDYFLTQLRVIATYLRLMIMPVNQNLDYDYPLYHSVLSLPVLLSLMLHITLLSVAVIMFIRSRKCQGISSISMRLAALGIFWFYLALMVESSIIPIRDVINEHRLYLPSGGILLLATALAGGYAACNAFRQRILWGFTIVCCLILMTASVLRNQVWKKELTMWQDVASKSPKKARAQFNVGFHLSKHFQQEAALPYLVRALEIDPAPQLYWLSINGSISMIKAFDGRSNLGLQYQITPESVNPEFIVPWTALSHNNLGLAYEFLGNLQWARNNFSLATRIDPTLDLAWFNLAIICARQLDRPGYNEALAKLTILSPPRAAVLSSLKLFP